MDSSWARVGHGYEGSRLSIAEWLVTRSRVRHLGSPVIALSPSSLPDTPEIWVFEPDSASFQTKRLEP